LSVSYQFYYADERDINKVDTVFYEGKDCILWSAYANNEESDLPYPGRSLMDLGSKCCIGRRHLESKTKGTKSVWNHFKNGCLLGLQNREYLAKFHTRKEKWEKADMIFVPWAFGL
jgi:hypothetical protein